MERESLKLYLVTDRKIAGERNLEEIVSEAVKGGVTMVQLREKDISTREFIELATRLRKKLQQAGIPLIINDRVDVALAVDADGVHIGQSDMPYETARRILGPDKIIGLSVESLDDVRTANGLDVDYLGISPVYPTPTKADTAPAFLQEGLREAVAISKHPCVGIGGMNKDTAAETIRNGAAGIAVVSAIIGADNPRKAAEGLLNIIENGRI